jgi:hypothetical protein
MKFYKMIGLGIAGNFTGHLEQAGESADFTDLKIENSSAPKGLFPFYLPSHPNSFLSIYPLSSDAIKIPKDGNNIQIEPEVAIVFDIVYDADNRVTNLKPRYFGAYNDCSIRRPGAKKISEKKNWGEASKGASDNLIKVESLEIGGKLDEYKIACFLIRDGSLHRYGIDSEVKRYSYFHEQLISWIIDKMNNQKDEGPLESIPSLLKECNYPEQALISIGATRYTPYGETTYLKAGDEAIVALYPFSEYNLEEIERIVAAKSHKNKKHLSILCQKVEANQQ